MGLPSLNARERYAQIVGWPPFVRTLLKVRQRLIDNKDITLGMNQKAVLESWGEPEIVEVAGNPVYGNERWKYSKFVSSEALGTKANSICLFRKRNCGGLGVLLSLGLLKGP